MSFKTSGRQWKGGRGLQFHMGVGDGTRQMIPTLRSCVFWEASPGSLLMRRNEPVDPGCTHCGAQEKAQATGV